MPEIQPTTQRSIFQRIGDLWLFLVGARGEFPVEVRIFHSICICLVLIGCIDAPYDLFAGMYTAAVSYLLMASVFSYQYYNSRFKGKPYNSIALGVIGLLLLSYNYFLNSGIHGSTDVIWPAYVLVLLAIAPYRQHFFWVVIYLVTFFLLHLFEYHHPELVKHPFLPGEGEFIDRVTAFPIPVLTIFIIIGFIRRSYDSERVEVEEKATTVENRNAQILYQKDLLEQSNAEKNKLLSILSHDLRAPFNNIQNYLRFMNESDLGSDERAMLENELLKSTDQTMELLSNLLYWSRSQMEGIEVNLATINLLDTLKTTIEIEKTLAENKNITLSYDIDPDATVTADTDMLQLVVRNLINNAIKFTSAGGAIAITTGLVNGDCMLSVSDNGKGIDVDNQQSVFSMTSRSTFGTNNEKGVGLGLPLCKEFMERQGGRISFESTPGQGSSFHIFIPAG